MKRKLISNGNPMENNVGFSRAVRVGPFISIGGTAPVDSEGKTVGIGNPGKQARQCLEIIKNALEQADSSLQDVVRTRVLLRLARCYQNPCRLLQRYPTCGHYHASNPVCEPRVAG